MHSFSQHLTENIHGNLIEYLTRQVFKTKNLARAVNATYKMHNGTSNMFLGGAVNFSKEELTDAYYADKAATIRKILSNLPVEKHEKRLEVEAAYFCLDIPTLKALL